MKILLYKMMLVQSNIKHKQDTMCVVYFDVIYMEVFVGVLCPICIAYTFNTYANCQMLN